MFNQGVAHCFVLGRGALAVGDIVPNLEDVKHHWSQLLTLHVLSHRQTVFAVAL